MTTLFPHRGQIKQVRQAHYRLGLIGFVLALFLIVCSPLFFVISHCVYCGYNHFSFSEIGFVLHNLLFLIDSAHRRRSELAN